MNDLFNKFRSLVFGENSKYGLLWKVSNLENFLDKEWDSLDKIENFLKTVPHWKTCMLNDGGSGESIVLMYIKKINEKRANPHFIDGFGLMIKYGLRLEDELVISRSYNQLSFSNTINFKNALFSYGLNANQLKLIFNFCMQEEPEEVKLFFTSQLNAHNIGMFLDPQNNYDKVKEYCLSILDSNNLKNNMKKGYIKSVKAKVL